jgi:hypothetical protein
MTKKRGEVCPVTGRSVSRFEHRYRLAKQAARQDLNNIVGCQWCQSINKHRGVLYPSYVRLSRLVIIACCLVIITTGGESEASFTPLTNSERRVSFTEEAIDEETIYVTVSFVNGSFLYKLYALLWLNDYPMENLTEHLERLYRLRMSEILGLRWRNVGIDNRFCCFNFAYVFHSVPFLSEATFAHRYTRCVKE